MEQKIAEILAELCGVEPEEIEPELNLFEEGLLDSFAVIQLVLALEEAFGVSLNMASLPREHIAALIREKKA
ncbi:MAG: D-alanine--poly(phosphoribitol) ligase subunit 2 [Oscillospiraceae bacterium]|nr:D-alanine--poly(phosphoribitol) ligase subunit 2 [Oscillospiraceae bacterium]RKJ53702.1 D-alanine--poly(phosphoribitol) ligase subunit 2 [bacterium 1XD42-8]RKJ63034.1 D-alanine--poly(phosphoribitol) ligase subunit 2 [bacterium 1XD42-1]